MKSTLMTVLACLATPSLAAEVRVAGEESSGIFTKIIQEPPSSSAGPAAYGANLPYHADNQENVPQYYDAQGRSRSRSYRRQPLQINHHEITTGQVNYQKNYQTKRVFSTPNLLQSVGTSNQNFVSDFNRPTSQFSGQHQSVSYDRNGSPIRAFTRPVQSAFSNSIASQPSRYANGRLQPQLNGNFQAFQSGLQQSGKLFGNRPINSQGVFPNSLQVGSTFQQVRTPNSNVNSFQQGALPSWSTNRRQGNRFAGRPPSGLSSSQFNSRPITPVGSQFNNRPVQSAGSQFNNRPAQSAGSQFSSRPVQSSGSQFNNRPFHSAGSQFSSRPTQSAGSLFNNRPVQSSGSQFSNRPVQFTGSQFNSRPIQSVGTQNNVWDRQQFSGLNDGQRNRQVSSPTGLLSNSLNEGNRGALSSQQFTSPQYPDFVGTSNAGRWQQGTQSSLDTGRWQQGTQSSLDTGRWQQGTQSSLDTGRWQQGTQNNLNTGRTPNQYAPSNQNFGNVPGGFSPKPTRSNLGYPVAGNSLT